MTLLERAVKRIRQAAFVQNLKELLGRQRLQERYSNVQTYYEKLSSDQNRNRNFQMQISFKFQAYSFHLSLSISFSLSYGASVSFHKLFELA